MASQVDLTPREITDRKLLSIFQPDTNSLLSAWEESRLEISLLPRSGLKYHQRRTEVKTTEEFALMKMAMRKRGWKILEYETISKPLKFRGRWVKSIHHRVYKKYMREAKADTAAAH